MCPCVAFRARWVVSWLTLIADGLDLDRYVSRTCYGVGVYYIHRFRKTKMNGYRNTGIQGYMDSGILGY